MSKSPYLLENRSWLRCSPLTLFGLVMLLLLGALSPAYGQRARNRNNTDKEEEEKKVASTMRETTYKKLNEAQVKSEANEYEDALKILNKLMKKSDLNSYETAQTYNIYAFVYYSMENYPKAIESYENVLSQDKVPEAMVANSRYSLAQLYFTTENWKKAIENLEAWIPFAEKPGPLPYVLMAQGYYQLKEYRKAIPPVHKAMELAKENGEPIQENWYLLLRVFHYELKEFDKVAEILEQLVRVYPKKEYWIQLSSIYSELDDESRQLSTLEVAYIQGFLEDERDIVNLAVLLLQKDVPYKAGNILQKGIDSGAIPSNLRNWRLLSQAWSMAQENENAIPAMIKVAELTEDGTQDVALAQIYMDLGQWNNAIAAARKGLEKGGLKRADLANVLIGQAYFNQDKLEEAENAFAAAQDDERSRAMAVQWINYIASERKRKSELKQAMN